MIAPVTDSTTWSSGLWLVEDAQGLIQSIQSGSWVDGSIGAISAGLDLLSVAMDPLGALASMAVGWIIEHVEPLREALEKLTGDADTVNSYATTWKNVSSGLTKAAGDLQTAAGQDLQHWVSPAASSFSTHTGYSTNALGGIGAAAAVLASATEGAGMIVATVREIVRDLIADCVSTLLVRVPEWLAEEGLTLGLATPWVAGQVTTLVSKWVGRIMSFLDALTTSIQSLNKLLS